LRRQHARPARSSGDQDPDQKVLYQRCPQPQKLTPRSEGRQGFGQPVERASSLSHSSADGIVLPAQINQRCPPD